MSRHPARSIVTAAYSAAGVVANYVQAGLWQAEEALVKTYFEPGGALLDIGCGAGRTSIALAESGFRVTGIDVVPEMIEAATKQAASCEAPVQWAVMDAANLDFDDASFAQAIFSFNGYEHIPDDGAHRRVLTEAWRVLKPGGFFILTSRSGVAFGRRWVAWAWMYFRHYILRPLGLSRSRLVPGEMVNSEGYFRYRSPFRIGDLLGEAGFQVVYFNSRKNIERGVEASWATNFSPDISLFFVARKPGGAANRPCAPALHE